MIKKIFFAFLLSSTAFCFGQNQKKAITDSLVNTLLREVVFDTSNYRYVRDSLFPFKIIVYDHFLKWDSLSLDFPKDSLPQTARERRFMLYAEHLSWHYNYYYVFCHYFTDSIFSEEDKLFMLKQSRSTQARKFWTLITPEISLTSKIHKKGIPTHYGYTFPVFSQDLRYAVIRRYIYYTLKGRRFSHNDSEWQTFYYKNEPGTGWKKIHMSYMGWLEE